MRSCRVTGCAKLRERPAATFSSPPLGRPLEFRLSHFFFAPSISSRKSLLFLVSVRFVLKGPMRRCVVFPFAQSCTLCCLVRDFCPPPKNERVFVANLWTVAQFYVSFCFGDWQKNFPQATFLMTKHNLISYLIIPNLPEYDYTKISSV